MSQSRKRVVALPADLIFAARMRSVARDVDLALARNVDDFLASLREAPAALAVVDLDRRGMDVERVIAAARASGARVLAYGSHVRADLFAAARAAGADRVMARSAFVQHMQELLTG